MNWKKLFTPKTILKGYTHMVVIFFLQGNGNVVVKVSKETLSKSEAYGYFNPFAKLKKTTK